MSSGVAEALLNWRGSLGGRLGELRRRLGSPAWGSAEEDLSSTMMPTAATAAATAAAAAAVPDQLNHSIHSCDEHSLKCCSHPARPEHGSLESYSDSVIALPFVELLMYWSRCLL